MQTYEPNLAPLAAHLRVVDTVLRIPARVDPQAIEAVLAHLAPLTRAGLLRAYRDDALLVARLAWARAFAEANGWRVASRFDPRRLAEPTRRRDFRLVLPTGARWLADHGFGLWRNRRPVAILGHVYPPHLAEARAAAAALGLHAVEVPVVSVYNPGATRVLLTTREPVDVVLPGRRDTDSNTNARHAGECTPAAR